MPFTLESMDLSDRVRMWMRQRAWAPKNGLVAGLDELPECRTRVQVRPNSRMVDPVGPDAPAAEMKDPYTCRYVLDERYCGGTSRVRQAICAVKSEWRWHFGRREPRETCTCLEDVTGERITVGAGAYTSLYVHCPAILEVHQSNHRSQPYICA